MAQEKFTKFVLVLKGMASMISEVKYDKDEKDIAITLALKEGGTKDASDLVLKRSSEGAQFKLIVSEKEQS